MTLLRKTPMARTSIRTSRPTGVLAQISFSKLRKPMKSKRPKTTKIRSAARGQECTLMIPGVCNRDTATVVLCHSNSLTDGKGMGLKAPDTAACFGCSSCHDVLDGRVRRPDWLSLEVLLTQFQYAKERTHEVLRAKGLI